MVPCLSRWPPGVTLERPGQIIRSVAYDVRSERPRKPHDTAPVASCLEFGDGDRSHHAHDYDNSSNDRNNGDDTAILPAARAHRIAGAGLARSRPKGAQRLGRRV